MRDDIRIGIWLLSKFYKMVHVNTLNDFESDLTSKLLNVSNYASNNIMYSHNGLSSGFVSFIFTDIFNN